MGCGGGSVEWSDGRVEAAEDRDWGKVCSRSYIKLAESVELTSLWEWLRR